MKDNEILKLISIDEGTGTLLYNGQPVYPDADRAKLASLVHGFTLAFTAPTSQLPDYFEQAAQITAIILLTGAATFSYSVNDGSQYFTPVVTNVTNDSPINIPAGSKVRWRITFASGYTTASVYIKLKNDVI